MPPGCPKGCGRVDSTDLRARVARPAGDRGPSQGTVVVGVMVQAVIDAEAGRTGFVAGARHGLRRAEAILIATLDALGVRGRELAGDAGERLLPTLPGRLGGRDRLDAPANRAARSPFSCSCWTRRSSMSRFSRRTFARSRFIWAFSNSRWARLVFIWPTDGPPERNEDRPEQPETTRKPEQARAARAPRSGRRRRPVRGASPTSVAARGDWQTDGCTVPGDKIVPRSR
jgi:hypothetical protein